MSGTIAKSGMRSEAEDVTGVNNVVDLRSDTVTRPTAGDAAGYG